MDEGGAVGSPQAAPVARGRGAPRRQLQVQLHFLLSHRGPGPACACGSSRSAATPIHCRRPPRLLLIPRRRRRSPRRGALRPPLQAPRAAPRAGAGGAPGPPRGAAPAAPHAPTAAPTGPCPAPRLPGPPPAHGPGRDGTGAEAAGRDGSGASASGPTPPAAASQRACAAGSPARSPEPRARACAEPPGGPRGAGLGLGSLGFRG